MKKFSLILILLLPCIALAQLQTGFYYKIKKEYTPFPWNKQYVVNIKYTTDRGKTFFKKNLCQNTYKLKAKLTQPNNGPVVVDFWSIKPQTDGCKNQDSTVNSSAKLNDSSYFILSFYKRDNLGIPTQYISIPYATWEIGLATIPLKYRFGKINDSIPNDATTNINAGIYLGRKWGRTRFYHDKDAKTNSWAITVACFFSPTVINITPENTRNEVKTKSNELALGSGIGILFSYRDINFGILGGYDLPLSNVGSKWTYTNRPWIGFGIGYKLGILGGK